jgi:hypothetical protein
MSRKRLVIVVFLGFSWKHTHFWETFTNFYILQKYIMEWIVPAFTGESPTPR